MSRITRDMGKFYIQSGNVSQVLSTEDAESAAIFTLQCTINKFFPVDEIEIRLVNRLSLEVVLRGLAELDSSISVSQIGVGRCEAGLFETEELFAKWRTRVYSISYIFDQFS